MWLHLLVLVTAFKATLGDLLGHFSGGTTGTVGVIPSKTALLTFTLATQAPQCQSSVSIDLDIDGGTISKAG